MTSAPTVARAPAGATLPEDRQSEAIATYNHVLARLRAARVAADARDDELRDVSLTEARLALAELIAVLDTRKGDEVARDLGRIFHAILGELSDLGDRPEGARVSASASVLAQLRDSFVVVLRHAAH
ncbi:MAG: flagellar protein FliS [Gemmatimonadaceae bacterium]